MKSLSHLLLSVLFLAGCAISTNSKIDNKMSLPNDPPKRVGVFPFTGEQPYAREAAHLFLMGLIDISLFEVIDEAKINQALKELDYRYSGLVDDATVIKLGGHLDLDAVFAGDLCPRNSLSTFNARIDIRLIDVNTGMILWQCIAQDERLSKDEDYIRYITLAVNNALGELKYYLDNKQKQ